jgi:hypothetical protein
MELVLMQHVLWPGGSSAAGFEHSITNKLNFIFCLSRSMFSSGSRGGGQ